MSRFWRQNAAPSAVNAAKSCVVTSSKGRQVEGGFGNVPGTEPCYVFREEILYGGQL